MYLHTCFHFIVDNFMKIELPFLTLQHTQIYIKKKHFVYSHKQINCNLKKKN